MIRINFDVFGDEYAASSRLRAWRLAEALRKKGHQASVGGATDVDIQVFQKVRPIKRQREARRHGAITVYDFDDNYLLPEVGTRESVLAFINGVDVVTVGSQHLLDVVSNYHDTCLLFENPLDVSQDAAVKEHHTWEERLVWFGNPANLVGLEKCGIQLPVTTITKGGDIPWHPTRVDEALTRQDLCVIPVEQSDWHRAKNANRMLKCIALQVPFLAANTPEHRRIVERYHLPEWMLVAEDADWNERINEVGSGLDTLGPVLRRARSLAMEEYGIDSAAAHWLAQVSRTRGSHPVPLQLNNESSAALSGIHMLIVDEFGGYRLPDTLETLRLGEVDYYAVDVVTVGPIPEGWKKSTHVRFHVVSRDFFELYGLVARVANERAAAHATVIARAGTKFTRGFYNSADSWAAQTGLWLFQEQRDMPHLGLADRPPLFTHELLMDPHWPAVVSIVGVQQGDGALVRSEFGSYCVWEALIMQNAAQSLPLRLVPEPFVLISPEVAAATPMDAYAKWVEARDPAMVGELPGMRDEWRRLSHIWHSAVIEEHQELFGAYAATIVPALTVRQAAPAPAPRPLKDVSGEGSDARALFPMLKRRNAGGNARMVRVDGGRTYLIESGCRRHVTSSLIARALEFAIGPIAEVKDDALIGFREGPPVEPVSDSREQAFVLVSGQRLPLRGFPLPATVDSTALDAFPLGDMLDVPMANQSLAAGLRSRLRPRIVAKALRRRVLGRLARMG